MVTSTLLIFSSTTPKLVSTLATSSLLTVFQEQLSFLFHIHEEMHFLRVKRLGV